MALDGTAILMADDDAETLEVLEGLIADEGATVRSATSAREALEILRTWTPNVLLLDVSMPEMDGCELLMLIHRHADLREVPAVAITGHDDARDRKRCTQAGFAGHIAKPFYVETLVKLIATLAPKPSHAA
jgi:two-component system, OmpR family, response regulator